MGKSKVNKEVAEKEVLAFLKYNKIRERVIKKHQDNVDAIVDLIMDGDMVVDNEKHSITYKLPFPILSLDGTPIYSEICIKNRVTLQTFSEAFNSISAKLEEGIARVMAIIAAASGLNVNLLKTLDMASFSAIQNVAVFLL